MTVLSETPAAIGGAVIDYHTRTKHHLSRYAAGPETLDWTSQPNPFREFAGSPRTVLPLTGRGLTAPFARCYPPSEQTTSPFSIESVGALLELSMGISAWKEAGPDLWAVRCNPSSGNLHPTEAYVICQNISGIADGVHHYISRDHALEQRCMLNSIEGGGRLWIGLTSIHWREAWKYGERAFRYCQLDIGHAIGALAYAAAALGWRVRLASSYSHNADALASLLGLDRSRDFAGVEKETPDLLLEIIPLEAPQRISRQTRPGAFAPSHWTGKANLLDPYPMYRWPVIDAVSAATRGAFNLGKPGFDETGFDETGFGEMGRPGDCGGNSLPPLSHVFQKSAADVISGRRSAQRFDARHMMPAADFFHLLDCLLARPGPVWGIWNYLPRIHLVLFVHRVEGVEPGLYILVRRPEAEESLRQQMSPDFTWRSVPDCPAHVPLFQLAAAACGPFSRTLNCHQAIASESCFSLAMLSEFEPIVQHDPWRYRQLHWEAGLLGQVLYLEAEAANLRGTGIGCFFDDAMHNALSLHSAAFQSLYHFTVGLPIVDPRISTLPAYPNREPSP